MFTRSDSLIFSLLPGTFLPISSFGSGPHMMTSLDRYLAKPEHEPPKLKPVAKTQLAFKPEVPKQMAQSYFVGAGYDGERRAVFLKLYDPQTEKIQCWYDNTGHTPYCLSKEIPENLRKNKELMSHPGLLGLEPARRFDALEGKEIPVTVVLARDPLSIGGRSTGCIRDIITAWEADIRYVENYIYDRHLEPGMSYSVHQGDLKPGTTAELPAVREAVEERDEEYRKLMERWLRLLEYPVPNYRRLALDIEVYSPIETRVPDPTQAEYKVICASLCGSDGLKKVLLLKQTGTEDVQIPGIDVEVFGSEQELLSTIFSALNDYPFILTFNGDDFDLRYLFHRALNHLGFYRDQIPIELGRESATVKYGVHLDLYK